MIKLFLIRHSQTDWNVLRKTQGLCDIELCQSGREQSKKLAQYFANKNIDAVFCSPLKRARQTAEIISEAINLTPTVHTNLIEINFGDWEGLTLKEINKKYANEFLNWTKRPDLCSVPNGDESLEDVRKRIDDFIDYCVAEYDNKNILVITHSVPAKVLILKSKKLEINKLDSIKIANSAVVEIAISENDINLISFNEVDNLEFS